MLEADTGVVVDAVADGSEALEALLARPYSIMITDLKMRRICGMELIEAVQQRRLPVSIIVTTGFGSINDAVQAMRLGTTDFLMKPIDIEYLRIVV